MFYLFPFTEIKGFTGQEANFDCLQLVLKHVQSNIKIDYELCT